MLRLPCVHVAIHDVTPAWTADVEAALRLCNEVGARPALLVVPRFHRRWSLDEHPRFVDRLRELARAGHELLLHGYHHLAEPTPPSVRGFLAQRVMSGGEAEFASLSREEAARRLDRGLGMFDDLGLPLAGFVAPAWQMPPWLLGLLAEKHITYTEDHLHVYDPVARRSRPSLVLNFASRTPARLWSSVAGVRVLAPVRRWLPARVALHPGDMHHPVLVHEARRVLRLVEGSLTERARDLVA